MDGNTFYLSIYVWKLNLGIQYFFPLQLIMEIGIFSVDLELNIETIKLIFMRISFHSYSSSKGPKNAALHTSTVPDGCAAIHLNLVVF